MSAPEVGDRVRVIAGPNWRGGEGVATYIFRALPYAEVSIGGKTRTFPTNCLEVVPTTHTKPPSGDAT